MATLAEVRKVAKSLGATIKVINQEHWGYMVEAFAPENAVWLSTGDARIAGSIDPDRITTARKQDLHWSILREMERGLRSEPHDCHCHAYGHILGHTANRHWPNDHQTIGKIVAINSTDETGRILTVMVRRRKTGELREYHIDDLTVI